MKKKILAGITTMLLLVPALSQAITVTTPEDYLPSNTLFTLDATVYGKLKDMIAPYVEDSFKSVLSNGSGKETQRIAILKEQLLGGARFLVSMATDESVIFTFPITNNQWSTLTQGTTKNIYGVSEFYSDRDMNLVRIGNYVVMSQSPDAIKHVIDLSEGAKTDSLSNENGYRSLVNEFLSPRLFGFSLNLKSVGEMIKKELVGSDETVTDAITNFTDLFSFEGMSLAEVQTGYVLNFKLVGNAAKLSEKGINMAGGNFVPTLYKQFPDARPLLYSESFNLKNNYEQSIKVMNAIVGSQGGQFLNSFYGEVLPDEFSIETVNEIFSNEVAFAIQADDSSPIPYITVMGNVSASPTAARKLIATLYSSIYNFTHEEGAPESMFTFKDDGEFRKITMDVGTFSGIPTLGTLTLTLGVTADNTLIVSTYPEIDLLSVRNGDALHNEIKKFPETQQTTSGLTYMNMRNIWQSVDGLLALHSLSLDDYRDYSAILEKIYGWKELLVVSHATRSDASVMMNAIVDNARHASYADFVSKQKQKDTDDDGVNDYEERYLYETPVDSADCNKDGRNDIDDLRRGRDPCTGKAHFKDVRDRDYYTDEVSFLKEQGIVSGYDDGSFNPGNNVNRAEFIQMVMAAFGNDLNIRFETTRPFVDVDEEAWYALAVERAYNAGFVEGNFGADGRIFRPGDPITRAEAITILGRASAALSKNTPYGNECLTNNQPIFEDVQTGDWFCAAVGNGHTYGIVKGRSAGKFDPNGLLNRADAAIMIRRALEKDFDELSRSTTSSDAFENIGEEVTPLFTPLARDLLK